MSIKSEVEEFRKKLKEADETLIERIFSIVLFALSFISIGNLLKKEIGGTDPKKTAAVIDIYVPIKVLFSALSAIFGWCVHADGTTTILFWIILIFSFETIVYNLLHILSGNLFEQFNSYKRNIILGFLNYFENLFNFSIIYSVFHLVRDSGNLQHIPDYNWIDYLYFSMGSGGIISFSNYTVYSGIGKILVMFQCVLFLMFFSLFLTYNLSLFINKKSG